MNTSMLPTAGYRLNEYMLVLQTHEDLWNRIYKVKKEFALKFGLQQPKFTKQHLTLARFITLAAREEKLLQRLQAIAMGMPPFKIELKDYGSFPTHSIVIRVATKVPVQHLVKQLKTAQDLMKLDRDHKPWFIEEPSFMIATRLKPWQYEQGWLDFSHRQFTSRFIADGMLLLKRNAGETTSFQIAKRFEFMNLPVNTKQASLFA